MGAYSGAVTNPFTRKKVNWRLAPGLEKLGRQLDKLGITWYSIGNDDHLDNVPPGGHTPFKPAAWGVVTAIDVMKSGYADVERRILKLMKTPDYDTSFIDFININYRQYDWDGRKQRDSGDGHLHLEVLATRTAFQSNLFYDMFGYPAGVVKPPSVTVPVVSKPTTPAPTVTITWKDDNVFKFVKLRSRDDVWLVLGDGRLQHLSKAQLKAVQDANLKGLPSGASEKDKAKVTEPVVVENEEALAGFGTEIVPQTTKVKGL